MDQLPTDHLVTSLQFTKTTYQESYPSIDPTNPKNSMTGKVAIVTGASRGVGAKGLAPAFAKAGVKGLVLVATNMKKLEAVEVSIKGINPAVQVLSVSANIAEAQSVSSLFARVKETFGHADILVNSAAVLLGGGKIHEEDPSQWWSTFEVNTRGVFNLFQAFVESLPSPDTEAKFINLNTTSWLVIPFLSAYCISKLAALQLVANIAAQYPNITTVSLHPGLLDTDMMQDEFRHFKFDSPELPGGVAVWLCRDEAKFLSGKAISSNWSVDDLVERREEILSGGLLQMNLVGKFGKEQFE